MCRWRTELHPICSTSSSIRCSGASSPLLENKPHPRRLLQCLDWINLCSWSCSRLVSTCGKANHGLPEVCFLSNCQYSKMSLLKAKVEAAERPSPPTVFRARDAPREALLRRSAGRLKERTAKSLKLEDTPITFAWRQSVFGGGNE